MHISFNVANGLRGYFAIVYDGQDVIETGFGSYETPEEAAIEAWEWAVSENYWEEADRLKEKYGLDV